MLGNQVHCLATGPDYYISVVDKHTRLSIKEGSSDKMFTKNKVKIYYTVAVRSIFDLNCALGQHDGASYAVF